MDSPTRPHDIAAEKSVLGALLIDQRQAATVMALLKPGDFFRAAHVTIYEAMLSLVSANVAIDLMTLKHELAKAGQVDEVGGLAYLSALTDGVPKASNVAYYASIIKNFASLRRLMDAGEWLAHESASGREAADIADEMSRRLSEAASHHHEGIVSAGEAARQYVSDVTSGTGAVPIPTRFIDLDKLVQGFKPQSLVILAARPSVGKTAMAMAMAKRMAKHGDASVIFSLEVGRDSLSAQLIAGESGVPSALTESGDATVDEYAKVNAALDSLDALPLHYDTSSTSVPQVWNWCRRLKAELGIKLAFIDYLQLLGLGAKADNREREIAMISRSLKLMAKELHIVVVALSQLGRAPEARRDKRPQLSDLRESGALEQDTDLALLLFRQEMYAPKEDNEGIAEVIVAKNRSGPVGTVRLAFIKQLARFDNLAAGAQTWEA